MVKKKVSKKKAIVKQDRHESLPDYIPQGKGRGFAGIETDDLELPRVKLIQNISPELDEYEDVSAGDFWHNVLEESFGPKLWVIPLIIQKAFVLWAPMDDGRGILARANDGVHWQPSEGEFEVAPIKDMPKKKVTWTLAKTVKESGLAEFGSSVPDDDSSKPAATKQYNILAYLPDHPDASPCVITLQRSAIKLGRRLISKLKVATANKGIDLFALQLKMSSAQDTNSNDQKYNTFKFDMAGFVKNKETYELCKAMFKAYSASGFSVKMDTEDNYQSSSSGEADGGNDDF